MDDPLLSVYKKVVAEHLEVIKKLLDYGKKYYKEYEKVRSEYGLDKKLGFNFFTAISEKYNCENLHAGILRLILNPNNKEIGNRKFLDCFLELIDCKNVFKKSDKVRCLREKKYSDILIRNDSKAIIIENKINPTVCIPNMPAQYMEIVKKEKLEVVKIIYLTLADDKKIDILSYVGKYKNFFKNPESKLYYLAIIDTVKKDLVHWFLPKCIKIAEKQEKEKKLEKSFSVFLRHYQTLLIHLGGEIMMRDAQKELIHEIYSNKEYMAAMGNLKDLITKEWLVNELREECIAEEVMKSDRGYLWHSCGRTMYKQIHKTDEFAVAYYTTGAYGFISLNEKGIFSKDLKKKLTAILSDSCFDLNSGDTLFSKDEKPQWIYREFSYWGTLTIGERAEMISKKLKMLEKKCHIEGK
ncbi:PD-(D/E)XK nuclease family protein [Treponema pedis]|uniref:PD-(D/E)XK nuclease family protein n=1 Tax=Treponema pedis TaxID=409322 RepID=A0A7S6WQN5_9SPIR|nr:PD-(D/E)XK nuclease family protein [Treponema pedis]QOW61588.1 PD-(D/E)XK nuclease family protein [Treponema pedis]